MDDSAAAAGSADVPGPVAPAEGAGADEADTEESSSDSDLPDTTAPAAAKAEERAGAADAARPERSAASDDVVMSEAAASDPSLTIGELVDKTSEKLKFMAGYMEGAARMVRAESLESSRAGAEHRRVLEHAEKLLRRSEEFLEQQDVEAGAAASGAPPSGSAAPDQDARLLGTSIRSWAKLRPRPRTSPWRMPQGGEVDVGGTGSRRPGISLLPGAQVCEQGAPAVQSGLARGASTEEAPDMPAEESDGTFVCPDCDVRPESVVRWHLHRAACHNVPLSKAIFPPPSAMDSYRQDFRGAWFRLSREGLFFEMTEAHRARASRSLGRDVVLPLLVKGDKIRLKDGTCLRYGEGFEEESEPEADPVTTAGGGSRVPHGMEMRDDPDEQEQVRKLRVRTGISVVATAKSRDKVMLRAYSFDAPSVLEALEAAVARGASCSLIADASQCSKTKLQWQSLKRVVTAGVSVRLATGRSVRDAYVSDGRGAAVGAGLKGLHHAKALLVIGDKTAELVVGSLNWSTSSKANSECGLRLAVASDAPVVTDFVRDFEAVFAGAALLDEFKPAAPKGAAASSSARQGVPTLTV